MTTGMEVEKYEALEEIGRGSFGVIKKVRRKVDGQILCRKEISYFRMSPKEREQLQAELAILKGLRHTNIVAYYEREHIKSESILHIYMEYCEHGDLGKRIRHMQKNNLMAEEDFVWSVFSQLVTALYRCHYGEDVPEVGKNIIGLGGDAKPIRSKTSHTMILHRDLKPENIFLGTDCSVKLGDFGLSKIIASHEFASTYVGTPFYMSPEICAGEPYSLYSDIWAFGCIMYELCAKEPPFNAKTHLELIQKIRLGRVKPLSAVYSQQLQETIQSCLRVNAQLRPDTVQLLNLPMVKLKRKEMEVVALGKQMKIREEMATRKLQEFEQHLEGQAAWREKTRNELDNILRREWEVKARLEIDRQVQKEMLRLQREYDIEVQMQVKRRLESEVVIEVSRRMEAIERAHPVRSSTPDIDEIPNNLPFVAEYQQSQSTSGEYDDFPSGTDLSELSLDSPLPERAKQSRKSGRTPFCRAQTMFEGSPLDVSMAEPSPAPIASLGLSPRRSGNRPLSQLKKNIFASAAAGDRKDGRSSSSLTDNTEDDDDDIDGIAPLPSPTRSNLLNNDPFKALGTRRPGLMRQKTAPANKFGLQPTLFGNKDNILALKEAPNSQLPTAVPRGIQSPTGRATKLPSTTAYINEGGSPLRKAPPPPTTPSRQAPPKPASRARIEADIRQTAVLNNHGNVQGRTLVELAQARMPLSDAVRSNEETKTFISMPTIRKTLSEGGETIPNQEVSLTAKMAWERPKSASTGAPATWDPEKDEMPSPFLVRGRSQMLPGSLAAPGMRHLR